LASFTDRSISPGINSDNQGVSAAPRRAAGIDSSEGTKHLAPVGAESGASVAKIQKGRFTMTLSIEIVRSFLLWCTIINYAILIVWFLFFAHARGWMKRLHGRWFRLSDEQFDAIHYAGMAIYKLGIFLFNFVPLVVLYILA
jgi:hypothetical protein